jgi:hypothetical protein
MGTGALLAFRPAKLSSCLLRRKRRISDAEWERIRPLLPAQQPRMGRPRHDHRRILNGIVAVVFDFRILARNAN